MDFDMDLINRALLRAGQESLTNEDKEKLTSKYKTITAFYDPTLQLLLAEADWTGLMKRVKLTEEAEENLSELDYAYPLPLNCSRAIEIDDNANFQIEGNVLYTDVKEPTLLYINNHRITPATALPAEDAGEVLYQGKRWIWDEETAAYIEKETQPDLPLYEDYELPTELRECFEYHLAAQVALKITGQENLYNFLLQLAMAIEDKSRKTSRNLAKSKQKGHTWWGERLGLISDEEDTDNVTY